MNNYLTKENPKTIFIAGGSGMVGGAIYKSLMKSRKYGNQKSYKILKPNRQELDLSNYSSVQRWFSENTPSIVIIAAAKVGGILANSNYPYDFILENLKIQTNIIEIAFNYKVKKLIFLGSSCIYPKFAAQPIKEDALLSNKLEKTNEFYAVAKIAGIKLCESLRIQHGFNAMCLMPTNLYGPGDNYHPQNSHVLPSFIRKFTDAKSNNSKNVICWGTGEALREFLYVEDLADACLFILDNWSKIQKNIAKNFEDISWINIGSDFEISIKDLAHKISDIVGYEGSIIWDSTKPNGTPRKKLDTKMINCLGWKAMTNLDEGIKKTLNHFEDENKLQIIRS